MDDKRNEITEINIGNQQQMEREFTNKARAVILSPATSQPRHHRRAAMLVAAGYDTTVYAFRRGLYEENTYPEGIDVVELGMIKSGKYLERIPNLLRAISILKKNEKKFQSPALIYTFGMDMALIGRMGLSSSIPFVYEVGDVRNPIPHTSIPAKVLFKLEKYILSKCTALTVTSECFLNDYFRIVFPGIEDKTIVIENMISREAAAKFSRPEKPKVIQRPIKIGFVGMFRYKESIVALMDAIAKRKKDYELHFYGDGPIRNVIDGYTAKYSNIFNHGSFVSSVDMKYIYESIDISYAVYDNSQSNVRMALPNKLYEAPYFGVPIAVAESTFLSDQVRKLKCGFVVEPQSENFIENWLEQLTPKVISDISDNLLRLDEKYMVENYVEIIPKLKKLGGLI